MYKKVITKPQRQLRNNGNFTSLVVTEEYIAHSIISAIPPNSFISPLLLSTGLYINRKWGSKLIVDLLAKLGVCASYYSVTLHELSAIKAEVTKIEKQCFTQMYMTTLIIIRVQD